MTNAVEGIALLMGPFAISFASAFLVGRQLARKAIKLPRSIKIFVAGLAGAIAPVIYLWIWQSIDTVLREARGDTSDYMGPMVILVYGFPLFIISSILCFVIASYAIRRAE